MPVVVGDKHSQKEMLRFLKLGIWAYNQRTGRNRVQSDFSVPQLQALLRSMGVDVLADTYNGVVFELSLVATIEHQRMTGIKPVTIYPIYRKDYSYGN
jgi:hypothetical protein